jgi:hypothetical protein
MSYFQRKSDREAGANEERLASAKANEIILTEQINYEKVISKSNTTLSDKPIGDSLRDGTF